ncbi:acetoacetate--CoA ligase [Bradyrhizobium sp. AUGA SZCCT0169]|uniref:acetoacetate--CoA ligase n=1 Tax=Bradyrhizobium sp. AUGA SZCCT0169 TaxID=2807663 RepID=UPI001BA745B6|nr:acetoacetate--CoA ligase [Bradyrhizobium sp. AUGA SZCCT0169]MBR1250247.1 acetoacetate--CoA ligase [Bradyrhizobium sp. AUGA SZCCT0169]
MELPLTNSARSFHESFEEAALPSDDQAVAHSQLTAFMQWCEVRTGQHLPDHSAMDRFSVEEFRNFWRLFLEWSDLPRHGALEPVCVGDACETARFFPDLRLNYAECLLAGSPDQTVLTACHAGGSRDRFTRGALRIAVARLATSLQRLGVRPGLHVAAIGRNNAEVVIAALATAAIGATFASCAPDMGVPAILARFAPLEPVVLFGCLRAEPWDPGVAVAERVAGAAAGLPGLAAIVALDNGSFPAGERMVPLHRFADLLRDAVGRDARPGWLRHPFNQPLFTMFSSGTTGAPKCIQHGTGGTLLEHVKEHRLHCDLGPGDKLFFQTSCGWMMWNWQLSALASGTELVLYDGPLEGPDTFWRIVTEERVTVFGTNPAYLHFCEQGGFSPGRVFDLSALRAVLSTGSILHPRQYDWVRDQVKAAMPLQSISGGTDIIGCFVLGNPNLPVHRGEAQCRSLGLDVRSLPPPDNPEALIGELVCANPFPSRPLGFHGDADGTRFHAAYFAQNPGFWTHGDLIEATPHGGWRLHGRSDGVLNVRGIRIGTAEIYRILDHTEEILEAMAVEQQAEEEPGGTRMVLLIVLREGLMLDNMLAKHIRSELARCGSPAFVPARIAQVEALPVTFNGKRSEAAARDAVNGRPVRNRAALQNPECLDAIAKHPVLRAPPAVRVPRGPPPGCEAIPDPERLPQELQAICERVLGVAPIGWSDNLLGLGADSLALLSLLLEIESYAGRPVAPSAFLAAPSIEGLITVLSGGEEAMTAQQFGQSGPHLRAVGPEDWEPICRFLEESFRDSGINAATWRRLFEHEWSDHGRGFILLDRNAVVGFIGAVTARRQVNGEAVLVCNLSSWVVHAQYRGWGMALLASQLEGAQLTYTSFTPQPISWTALMAQRFKPLESHRIAMLPLLQAETMFGPNRPVISFDPAVVRERLTGEQRQIFDDHARYDCLQLTVSDGSDYAYLVVKRRIHRVAAGRLGGLARVLPLRIPYSDILHCSAPELLLRHLERVKLTILRRQRTAALVADARLFPVRPRGVLLPVSNCYRSASIAAGELDRLYSEIVLLPI